MSEMVMRKDLLNAVSSILSDTESSVKYVGPKPWYERTLNKLKKGLFATAVFGAAALGISHISADSVNSLKEKAISTVQTVKSELPSFDLSSKKIEQKLQAKADDLQYKTVETAKKIVKSQEFQSFIKLSTDWPNKVKSINVELPSKQTLESFGKKIEATPKNILSSINDGLSAISKTDTFKTINSFGDSIKSTNSSVQNKYNEFTSNLGKTVTKQVVETVKSDNVQNYIKKSEELPTNIKEFKVEAPTTATVENVGKKIIEVQDNLISNASMTAQMNLTEALNSNKFKSFFSLSSSMLEKVNMFSSDATKLTEDDVRHVAIMKQKVEGTSNVFTEYDIPKEEPKIVTEVDTMKAKYPSVNFDSLETQRDVSKEFFGVNNFIALAAEMEGFRGDLHKDPAVGLNIGFGYNITKRAYASQSTVEEDLKSIGMSDVQIQDLIKLAKTPQSKLARAIKEYNKKANLENNQLITMTQGVALLHRTEHQYRADAANVFSKTWDKKGTNEQEVLTYAAYKAGGDALSKYKQAIKASEYVYKKKTQTPEDLKMIAKHLMFYYKKDGGEYVLDTRASLIAQTFVNPEFLAIQIGKKDVVKTNAKKLNQQKIDFSHLPLSRESLKDPIEAKPKLEDRASADYSTVAFNTESIKKTLDAVRGNQKASQTILRMG